MNAKTLLLALAVGSVAAGCTGGINQTEVPLKSAADSAVFFLGYTYGKQISSSGVNLEGFNKQALFAGLNAGYAGDLDLTPEQERQIGMLVRTFVQKSKEEAAEKNRMEGERFLDENAKKAGVKMLSDGVQYREIKVGNGPKPTLEDKVRVSFTGRLIDGKEFDSSAGLEGGYMQFPVAGVIPGWVVALLAMPVGSKWEVFLPSHMGYGSHGYGPIPDNATLIFEMELLGIVPRDTIH